MTSKEDKTEEMLQELRTDSQDLDNSSLSDSSNNSQASAEFKRKSGILESKLADKPSIEQANYEATGSKTLFLKMSGKQAPIAAKIENKMKSDKLEKSIITSNSPDQTEVISISNILIPESEAPWVQSQVKSFVRWANTKLIRRGFSPIHDITEEFKNGYKLAELSNACFNTGISLPNPSKNPRNETTALIYQRDRVNSVLSLSANVLKLGNMKAMDIVEGDLKHKLALLWKIIMAYNRMNLSEEDSDLEKAVTIWIQRILSERNYEGIKGFSSLTKDLRDGLILSAILNYFDGASLDYSEVLEAKKAGSESNSDRLRRVIEVAKVQFDIQPLLDAEDIDVDEPDTKALLTYLSEWLLTFTVQAQKKAAFKAIQEFASVQMRLQQLTDKYVENASDVHNFCVENTDAFKRAVEKASLGESMTETREKLKKLQSYYLNQKGPFDGKFVELSSILMELSAVTGLNNRKMPEIEQELSLGSLQERALELNNAEREYHNALNDKLATYFKTNEQESSERDEKQREEKLMEEIRNAFLLFAEGEGKLGYLKFKAALQSVGIINEAGAWKVWVKKASNGEFAGKGDFMNLETFIQYCLARLSIKNDKEGVLEAFKLVEDKDNTGKIKRVVLHENLKSTEAEFLGERLEGTGSLLGYVGYVENSFSK